MTEGKSEIIRICFVTDENFLEKIMVSIGSILECRSLDDEYEIYVLSDSISDAGKEKIRSLSRKNFMITVLDCEIKNDFPQQREAKHISKSALMKFEIINNFKGIDKILYLDGDILALQDVKKVYSISLGEHYVAAVKDFRCFKDNQCIDADLYKESYFNSGVMLLNLKKLRENHVYDKVIDYRKNKINTFMDQDAFNVGFKDHIKYMPLHYNAIVTVIWHYKFDIIREFYELEEKNLFDFYNNMILIHFTYVRKPWIFCDMPFSNVWRILYKKYVGGRINRKLLSQVNAYIPPYMKRMLLLEKNYMNKIHPRNDCIISVVMPVHNAEKYIRKSIASILNQTFTYFELIIVDDASTDNSLKICRDIAMLDDRVHVFQMERNSGYGQARNEGMSRAKGKYVAFMEAGCEFQTSALEALYEKAEYYSADVVSFAEWMWEEGKKTFSSYKSKFIGSFCLTEKPEFVYALPCNPWNKMCRRTFLLESGLQFQDMPSCNDLFFHYATLFQAKKIVFVEENLMKYSSCDKKLFLSERKQHPTCVYMAICKTFKELRGRFLWEKLQPYYNSRFISDIDYELQQLNRRDKNRMIAFWQKRGFRNIGIASGYEQNFGNRYGFACYVGIQTSQPGTDREYLPGNPHRMLPSAISKGTMVTGSVREWISLAKMTRRRKAFCGIDAFRNLSKVLSALMDSGDFLIDASGNNCGHIVFDLPVCSIEVLAHLPVRPLVIILDERQLEVRKKLEHFGYRFGVDFIDGSMLKDYGKKLM